MAKSVIKADSLSPTHTYMLTHALCSTCGITFYEYGRRRGEYVALINGTYWTLFSL